MERWWAYLFCFVGLLLVGCTAVSTNHPIPTPAEALSLATAVPPATFTPWPNLVLPDQPLAESTVTATVIRPSNAPLFNVDSSGQIIGASAEGRPITVYRFGSGARPVVFVGGIHGGYEWNTILLAYEAIDYFAAHPELIPPDVSLYIIPSANPDGQFQATQQNGRFTPADVLTDTVSGRFNANGVDLNRNWDCEWAATAAWRENVVSGGERPFSEPESVALRDYLIALQPAAVVFWHSSADGVYAAGCPETDATSLELAQVYGAAASYPVHDRFDSYSITGDAADWLMQQGIPTITVELINHTDTDWLQNLEGILALVEAIK